MSEKLTNILPLQRMVWRHLNSGSIPIQGAGLSSNRQLLTTADPKWLNEMFPDLEFRLEEWSQSEGLWVEVTE